VRIYSALRTFWRSYIQDASVTDRHLIHLVLLHDDGPVSAEP